MKANLPEIAQLFYLRRIWRVLDSQAPENNATAANAIRGELQTLAAWMSAQGIDEDNRKLEMDDATIAAVDTGSDAANQTAIIEANNIDYWLSIQDDATKIFIRDSNQADYESLKTLWIADGSPVAP